MFYIFFALIFIPLIIFFPAKVYGKKNIKKKGTIYACNHRSLADPFLLYTKVRTKLIFMGKKELVNTKFKKWFLVKVCGMIPVDRGSADIESVKQTLKILKEGKCLAIFPEGTRKNISDDESFALKNGTCMFAIKTKTPITPVYIAEKQRKFRKNKIVFGKAFELSEFYDKKINKENLDLAGKVLSDKMEEVKQEYLKFEKEKEIIKQLKKQKRKVAE